MSSGAGASFGKKIVVAGAADIILQIINKGIRKRQKNKNFPVPEISKEFSWVDIVEQFLQSIYVGSKNKSCKNMIIKWLNDVLKLSLEYKAGEWWAAFNIKMFRKWFGSM